LLEDESEWKRVSREGRARMEKNCDRDMILDRDFALKLVDWLNRTNVDISLEDRRYLLLIQKRPY